MSNKLSTLNIVETNKTNKNKHISTLCVWVHTIDILVQSYVHIASLDLRAAVTQLKGGTILNILI